MFTLRTHVVICVALFAAMIGGAIIGGILQKFVGPPTGAVRYVIAGIYFTIVFAFGMSAIPVMVKLVVGAQVQLGNENVAAVAAAVRHQNVIIWALWGLIGLGTVIAVPAMLLSGAVGDGPQRALNRMFEGPVLGTLVARPDMTVNDMVQQSTMKIDVRHAASAISDKGVLDYKIPGTGITLTHARYYYITTYSNDPARIRAISIGTSREKRPLAEIDSADAELQARLARDGWLAGHELYRTEEDQTLHGGLKEGPEGRHWMKDSMVLTISRNRMDEAKPGEDPRAGFWIQYIDLWPVKEFPNFDRYVFQPRG